MAYIGPYQIFTIDSEESVSRVGDWEKQATSINAGMAQAKAEADWAKKAIAGPGQDVNSLTTPGFTGVLFASTANLPVAVVGTMEVLPFGSGIIQRYTTWETPARVYIRRFTGTAWSDWDQQASNARVTALETDKWLKSSFSGPGRDLNNFTTSGFTGVIYAVTANVPVQVVGTLEVFAFGTGVIQRYTTWETSPRVFLRRYSGGWGAWAEQPSATSMATINARIDQSESKTGSGMKLAPLAVTAPGTAVTEDVPAGSIRWPLRFAVPVRRWRLHIRNNNPGNSTTTTGAVSFTGLWLGARNGAAMTGSPTQVSGAFTTPADGSEYVSKWINTPIPERADMFLSTGWTNAAGQLNQVNQGGSYRSTNPADANTLAPTLTESKTSPFNVWIEAEVPAATPIVGGFGDSLTVGTATTLPVYDSWLSIYCRDKGALPYMIAQHGSSFGNWAENSPRWDRFAGMPKPDAVIHFLGQNDLIAGIDLATMQARSNTLMPVLKSKVSPTVYLATLTPGNAKSGEINTVRQQYNAWLKTLPGGARDCFDFSAIVSTDDTTISAGYNADGLHFNTAAHTALAGLVKSRPVSPEVLTPGDIVSLKALAG